VARPISSADCGSRGLSLIGAVVAEIAAAPRRRLGLAFRIAESGYLQHSRMFAALLLLSAAGIVIYGRLARFAPGHTALA
jgi:NitT/TauT family transport system permease protein